VRERFSLENATETSSARSCDESAPLNGIDRIGAGYEPVAS
jgi:hypothetical protein